MNNLENKDILPDDILSAIDYILEKQPNAIFGGSIALNAVGLLNRKISDIDLFFPLDTDIKMLAGLHNDDKDVQASEPVTDINGNKIQRVNIKINGIKVDCFKVPDNMLQHSLFSFLGKTIRIQNVNYAIEAKIQYAKKGVKKHIDDLQNIDIAMINTDIDSILSNMGYTI